MDIRMTFVSILLIAGLVYAQPPPPVIDQVTLDPLPPTTVTPDTTIPPTCPDLMCTMEFIPEECRTMPVIQLNGINCSGCPQWKEMCKNDRMLPPSKKPEVTIKPGVACPILSCQSTNIPKACEYIETYEFLGRKCQKCPIFRAGCTAPIPPQTPCPVEACSLLRIPSECREAQYFDFGGRRCEGCPEWRAGCNPTSSKPDNNVNLQKNPEVACPLLACDSYVPKECRVVSKFNFRGKMCQGCPTWLDGCREEQRLNNNNNNNAGFGNVPAVIPAPCPRFPCSTLHIPKECKEEQPFDFRGTICYRCPRWRAGCQPSNLNTNNFQNKPPQIACPLVKCEVLNVPKNCIQEEFFQFGGRPCHKCPSVKNECQRKDPPRPIAMVSPSDRTLHANIACPMMGCPLMFIPPECEDVETFQFQGKTCKGCPKYRVGCTPTTDGPVPNVDIAFPQIPRTEGNVVCPLVGCPLILIPDECRDDQPYPFQGRTCYRCPKWRKGCVPRPKKNDNIQSIDKSPVTGCPLYGCPKIFIPEECRDEQSYEFRGRTCYMCPKFRPGCIPNENAQQPNAINSGLTDLTNFQPKIDVIAPRASQKACPLMKCSRMYIPAECADTQSYQFHGKTCFQCPKWKEGCIPGQGRQNVACPIRQCPFVPSQCEIKQSFQFNGKTCMDCPKWREGCMPLTEKRLVTPDISCPPQACPAIFIPAECEVKHPFQFNGKTCFNCPTSKEGCLPKSNDSLNRKTAVTKATTEPPQIACPLQNCPANQIPQECIQEEQYQFQGKTCYNCPTKRLGCEPKGLQESLTDQSKNVLPGSAQNKDANIACPLIDCSTQQIPDNCKENVPYNFLGIKTCYQCPKWRQGCTSISSTPSNIAEQTVKQNTNSVTSGSSNSITNLKEIIPVSKIVSVVNAINCPPLPCPAVDIPFQCRQNTEYNYQGRLCRGCPTWRVGCNIFLNRPQDVNMNGMMAFNLFNEMMFR